MGCAEVVTNGWELSNEIVRLVQMPSPLPDNGSGEKILAGLFKAMLGGNEAHRNIKSSAVRAPSHSSFGGERGVGLGVCVS